MKFYTFFIINASSLTVGAGAFSSSLTLYKAITVGRMSALLYVRFSLKGSYIHATWDGSDLQLVARYVWMSCESAARKSFGSADNDVCLVLRCVIMNPTLESHIKCVQLFAGR